MKAGAASTGAGLAVHQIRVLVPVFTCHEEDVEDLQVTFITIIGRFILHTALVDKLLPGLDEVVPLHLAMLNGLHKSVLYHLV